MLSYSGEVYLSVLQAYNTAIWPAPIVALLFGLIALGLIFVAPAGGDRLVSALLAAAWFWVGAVYFQSHLASIDFAAPTLGWIFFLQSLLLVWRGLLAGNLTFGYHRDFASWIGLGLVVFALVVQPLVGWVAGDGWTSATIVGLAPGPTALFTLGLLLLASGRECLYLAVIPLLWLLVWGLAAWQLDIPADYALPLGALLSLGFLLRARRPSR